MSYATIANRPNPVAALGALGVPSAFGALLVVGLAVTATVKEDGPGLDVFNVKPEVIEEPEIEPVTEPRTDETQTPQPDTPYTPPPRPDTDFTFNNNATGPITPLPPGPAEHAGPAFEPLSLPDLGPMLDPVSASPKGNPGGWITNNDYRTSWINRGYTGVANFTLLIDARGRVSGCTITGSTGHPELDNATCRLLERRARFEPAKDSSGNAVAGSYRSSVRWTIPD